MSFPRTMSDLVNLTYGERGAEFIMGLVQKSDDALTTSDAGIINPMYGKVVWDWLNKEDNAFSLLPKKPWRQSGFRVITADRSGKATGVDEEGALPDTDHPTRAAILNEISEVMTRFEITRKAQLESEIDDGIDAWPQERNYQAQAHASGINEMLLADASAAAAGAGAHSTNAKGSDFESIDRMISSDAEEDDFGGSYNGWFDVYESAGDRDSGTTYDAVYDGNGGTDRPLTLAMIDDLLKDTKVNGANRARQIFLTGEDTLNDWMALVSPQFRFEEKRVTKGVNGVRTASGTDVGFDISAYRGVPIFTSIDVPSDGSSRIYLIDLDHMYFKVRVPTIYLETDLRAHMLLSDSLKRQGAYLTTGQLECTRFNVHGKIRDLE